MKHKIIILLFLLLIFSYKLSEAYDDGVTHRDITIKAVENSVLKSYLSQNLGAEFSQDYKSVINSKKVIDWIKDGSIAEDSPMCRASNHFHNPLLSWDKSYVTDDPWWFNLDSICYFSKPFYSNVTWGTGYLSPSGTKTTVNGQGMGWDNSRLYYRYALTNYTKTEREAAFANMFQALGQVLHLIEDGAQPAHVRNDFLSHLNFTGIKSVNPSRWFGSRYEHYVKIHPELVTGVGASVPAFGRLTDFWDTDTYNGTNPSTSLSFGITEFTNANYFSDETIPNNNPTPEHIFPYPQVNSNNTQICIDYAPSSTDLRRYISRKSNGACPQPSNGVDHFATPSILNADYMITNQNISEVRLWLDDNVYNTYAQKLLPRAVGYSAGLLNYFFHGQINIEKDPNNSSQYVIKNESDEDMDGTFTLCYDDANENRKCFANWGLQIGAGGSKSVSFTAPTSPEPKEKGKYILVFQGILGNESGAVVGKMVKLCGGSATITISGSDAPQNGSQYTATGGESPYTWTISKGSITKDGVVTVSGQCGVATITVKDSCGNQTTKDVRMSNGVWVLVSASKEGSCIDGGCYYTDSANQCLGDWAYSYSGVYWTIYCVGTTVNNNKKDSPPSGSACCAPIPPCGAFYDDNVPACTWRWKGLPWWQNENEGIWRWRGALSCTTVYKWNCP